MKMFMIALLLVTYWVTIAAALVCGVAWVWGVFLPKTLGKIAVCLAKRMVNNLS